MRVTEVLWRWKKALPGGDIWRGKHRLYKKVTPKMIAMKRHEFDLEEKNMFYLRHPYLTIEQSRFHSQCFNDDDKLVKEMEDKKRNWREPATLGDRLGFLKVADKWE